MDWQTTAFLFPGQGSQQVGMGKALVEQYPAARDVFIQADEILGYSLSELCFSGPAEQLNETLFTQPALYVTGIAALQALHSQLNEIPQPAYVAGHSLGEFTALVAAEALSFEDGLQLVHRRASLMKQAGEESPGAVAALLGLDIDAVQGICEQVQQVSGEIVVVANDNCPGQIVISGSEAALDQAVAMAKSHGAKRAVKLAVSVAVHSPLMQPAAEQFALAVQATNIQNPSIPVVGNVTASVLTTADVIRDELTRQLTGSVRWRESMETMLANGVTTFLELGPGGVLTGLLKRIDRNAEGISAATPEELTAFAK